jgi:hypothetical protein
MLVRTMTGFMMLIGVAATGCPGSDSASPRAACEDIEANTCERLYACFTPTELAAANFPADEAACVSQMQAMKGCANQTTANACMGNQHYHPDQASECADQITGLTCGQIRDQSQDLDAQIPACGKICAID